MQDSAPVNQAAPGGTDTGVDPRDNMHSGTDPAIVMPSISVALVTECHVEIPPSAPGGSNESTPLLSGPAAVTETQIASRSTSASIPGTVTESAPESEPGAGSSAAPRPATRLQHGISKRKIYTDGTIPYGKFGLFTHKENHNIWMRPDRTLERDHG
jgi:hypothetical protein